MENGFRDAPEKRSVSVQPIIWLQSLPREWWRNTSTLLYLSATTKINLNMPVCPGQVCKQSAGSRVQLKLIRQCCGFERETLMCFEEEILISEKEIVFFYNHSKKHFLYSLLSVAMFSMVG